MGNISFSLGGEYFVFPRWGIFRFKEILLYFPGWGIFRFKEISHLGRTINENYNVQ